MALATAANVLLASESTQAAGFGTLDDSSWQTDAMFLVYAEPERVAAFEAIIQTTHVIDTDESLTFKFTLDTLTGASGSGAVPSRNIQTFTQPSGNGSYTAGPREVPLDDTFEDDRFALNFSWNQALSSKAGLTLGGNVSNEYDYLFRCRNGFELLSRISRCSSSSFAAASTYCSGASMM